MSAISRNPWRSASNREDAKGGGAFGGRGGKETEAVWGVDAYEESFAVEEE